MVSSIQVTEVGDGRLSLKSSPAGLVLKADNVSLDISADWNISVPLLGIFTGSINVTAKKMSFKIEFRITSNNQGHPQINATSCSFEIQDIGLEFYGVKWYGSYYLKKLIANIFLNSLLYTVLNLMHDFIRDELKSRSKELVCDKLIKNHLKHLNIKIASSSREIILKHLNLCFKCYY